MAKRRRVREEETDRAAARGRAVETMARLLESARREDGSYDFWLPMPERSSHPELASWYAGTRAEQAEFVAVCLEGALEAVKRQQHPCPGLWSSTDPATHVRDIYLCPVDDLLKRDLPFTEDQLGLLAEVCGGGLRLCTGERRFVTIFERAAAAGPLPRRAIEALARWRDQISAWEWNPSEIAALCLRLDALTGRVPAESAPPPPPEASLAEPKHLWRRFYQAAAEAQRCILEGRRYELDPWLAAEDVLAHQFSDRAAILAMGSAALSRQCRRGVSMVAMLLPGAVREKAVALAPGFCRYLDDLFESVASGPDEELAAAFFGPRRPLWQRGYEWAEGVRELAEALAMTGRVGPRFAEAFGAFMAAANAGTDSPIWGRHLEAIEDELSPRCATVVRPGDAWANEAIAMLGAVAIEERDRWVALLEHAAGSEWARPPAGWLERAGELVGPLGDRVAGAVSRWLRLVGKPGTRGRNIYGWPPDATYLMEGNSRILKGLIWAATLHPTAELASALAGAAVECDRRVLRLGPRNKLVRNACLAALSVLPGQLGAAQLGRARQLVKYKGSKVMGDRALARAAAAAGVSPVELLETAVPTYGLNARGEVDTTIGGVTARIRIVGPARTDVRWRAGRGRWSKTPPDEVAAAHGEAVERVGAMASEIAQMLAAHRLRLERLLPSDRSWPLARWRALYHAHPLLSHLCRRLIWRFESGGAGLSGLWSGSGWTDARGGPVKPARSATVRLWHPIDDAADEVLAWRVRLEEAGVTQPFRQAHREVYLLTDAERGTGVYSNRFGAHILRARQFAALLHERGWEGNPALAFEATESASVPLPEWGLRAEFVTEPTEDEPGDRGMYELVATDQVRFKRSGTDERLSLESVPRRVFSEVMRDVDLFVSVASVGNNPQWQDGGPAGRHRDYWWEYSFGGLLESGRSRLEILERLLPRLSIAGVCSLVGGKFLRVQGRVRGYKVHLGSGNILMEPDDQYLCIVPNWRDESVGAKVFLPFEGDRVLAIILSKAFMLADDDKIKDSSIASQIRKGR